MLQCLFNVSSEVMQCPRFYRNIPLVSIRWGLLVYVLKCFQGSFLTVNYHRIHSWAPGSTQLLSTHGWARAVSYQWTNQGWNSGFLLIRISDHGLNWLILLHTAPKTGVFAASTGSTWDRHALHWSKLELPSYGDIDFSAGASLS